MPWPPTSAKHPVNILSPLVAFDTTKAVVTVIVVKFVHPLNISLILVILLVSNNVKSSDVKEVQFLNIPFILVVDVISTLSQPSIVVRLVNPEKKLAIVVDNFVFRIRLHPV